MNPFSSILDFLFPVRCVGCGRLGSFFCPSCSGKISYVEHSICPYCKRNAVLGKTHFVCQKSWGLDGLSSGFYFKGPIKKAVHELKYRNITSLQDALVNLLITSLEKQDLKFCQEFIVPIPLYKIRQRQRGFNQAELLSRGLADSLGLAFNLGLIRTRNTATQVKLTEKERQINLRGAFAVTDQELLRGKKVLLVDDVFTTGATLFSAAGVLKKAGALEVWGLTLARAQNY